MKVTIEFDLSPGSDDHFPHLCAIHGVGLASALQDVRETIRNKLKYVDLTEGEVKHITEIMTAYYTAVEDLPDTIL